MTTRLEAVLERLKTVAREEIVRVIRQPNTCIATSRILQAVLENFKFQSDPVATKLTACNRIQAEIFAAIGGRDNADLATLEQKEQWQREGAWATAISPETEAANAPMAAPGWNGHLVLRAEGMLVDGSIEMCNKPEKGLVLPKLLWVPVDSDWDKPYGLVIQRMENGCEVTYEKLNDDSWRTSSDWTEPFERRMAAIVDGIIRKVSA